MTSWKVPPTVLCRKRNAPITSPHAFTGNWPVSATWTTRALAARAVFCHVSPGKMPLQSPDSPLGAFLKALGAEKIDCILIGAMAAIEQGAPLMRNGAG